MVGGQGQPGLPAALIVAVMTAEIAGVHWRKAFGSRKGGAEYSLVVIVVVFAVSAIGAGEYSLDHALGIGDAGLVAA
jgi:uncharacterized membrane protein YphA (DoxX/SURF4 family)